MFAAMLLLCLTQEPKTESPLAPDAEFNYATLEPGDVASVWSRTGSAMIAMDYFAYHEMVKCVRAQDDKGLEELAKNSRVMLTKNGTQARVLQLIKEIDGTVTGAEVRLQNAKGETLKAWILGVNLARLIPAGEASQIAERKAEDARRDNERRNLQQFLNAPFKPGKPRPRPPMDAKTMWARAQEIEKADPQLAAMYCRALAKGHPSAPEVKLSREMLGRLKAK